MGVVGTYVTDPRRLVRHVWNLILVFAMVFFVGCVAVAAQHNIVPQSSKAAGFVAVWSMLVVLAASLYGELTLSKWQSHFTMGVFLGLVSMLTQYNLTIFALFAAFSRRSKLDGDGLVAAFSFFLFILYGAFSVILIRNRKLFVAENQQLPPTPVEAVISHHDIHYTDRPPHEV